MVSKRLLLFTLPLLVACQNSQTAVQTDAGNPLDSIPLRPPLHAVNTQTLSEDFIINNKMGQWDEFLQFQESIEDLSQLNPEGLQVFLVDILNKTKQLLNAPFPEPFDSPQIKSRVKLVQMQTMKSIYFTQHYTQDSLLQGLDKLYQFYNILLDRMVTYTREEDIFSDIPADSVTAPDTSKSEQKEKAPNALARFQQRRR